MNLYEHDEALSTYGIDVPPWFSEQGDGNGNTPSPNDVAAILEGGCSSGVWMPAVTYREAREIMALNGDKVLDFIEDSGIDFAWPPLAKSSWDGMACHALSTAVELWCKANADAIRAAIAEHLAETK